MPGKSAEEVERLATIPLEKNLNGIPNEQKLYSSSLFGLSVIKVVFADGLPSSLIRQQVLERIYQTELPDGVKTIGRWLDKPYIKNGRVKLRLDSDLAPYLLNLVEGQSTRLFFMDVVNLKSIRIRDSMLYSDSNPITIMLFFLK